MTMIDEQLRRRLESIALVLLCACAPKRSEEPPGPAVVADAPAAEPTPASPDVGARSRTASEALTFECASKPVGGWERVHKRDLARLVDDCALEILVGLQVDMTDASSSRTELAPPEHHPGLPFVRTIRSELTRYPRAVTVDVYRGRVLGPVDVTVMNELLSDNQRVIATAEDAESVARTFMALHHPGYQAKNVTARPQETEEGFNVTGTYEQTLVWSPPGQPWIAGARTALNGFELVLTRDGQIARFQEEELEELSTRPPVRPAAQ